MGRPVQKGKVHDVRNAAKAGSSFSARKKDSLREEEGGNQGGYADAVREETFGEGKKLPNRPVYDARKVPWKKEGEDPGGFGPNEAKQGHSPPEPCYKAGRI